MEKKDQVEIMEYENITIEDCIDNYEKKRKAAVIHNGQIKEFVKEEKIEKRILQ